MGWKSITLAKPWIIATIAIGTIGAAAAVVAARWISVYGGWASTNPETLWYIGLWNLAFVCGLILPLHRLSSLIAAPCFIIGPAKSNTVVALFSIVAILGAAVLTYEFAYIRGYGFSTTIYDIRNLEVSRAASAPAGSWRGGFGRLFIPALIAAWVVACLRWRQMKLFTLAVMFTSTVVVFAYQFKFEGGRFFPMALAISGFAASIGNFLEDGRPGEKPALRNIRISHFAPVVVVAGLFVAVAFYSAQVFVDRGDASVNRIGEIVATRSDNSEEVRGVLTRAAAQGASPYALAYLQYAMNYPISVSDLNGIQKFGSWNYAIAMSWLYLTQGVSQFDFIIDDKNLRLANGSYQFPQLAILAGMVLGKDVRYDEAHNLPVYGAYVTLPGAAYVDFGLLGGFLFAAILGATLRISVDALYARSGSFVTFFGPLVLAILLISPITSLVPVLWPSFFWLGTIAISSFWRRHREAQV